MDIIVYIDPPRDKGFGWTVSCDQCDFDERMLSHDGARIIAKDHAQTHIIVKEAEYDGQHG